MEISHQISPSSNHPLALFVTAVTMPSSLGWISHSHLQAAHVIIQCAHHTQDMMVAAVVYGVVHAFLLYSERASGGMSVIRSSRLP